ncbi:MAG: undecaprenyldiphospho-muramoylpentapeptide beta-N-acetylglucosaminyltransferase [Prevotellaceae bacterium]|jgi:UDP-N-acetylglucosamine--N-acetylmuramyl-(pentapeptide) pyrophosphoryl-undecaprenol N-acetylglucosamine transferase|nr:undecaprenyldiphospho-muramoylpentapeptide beta-N-acetylglucosaminyltransferase [Prevotellaceae bacterium]
MTSSSSPRIIISGGGTGGHIFPAISIANAIRELCPDADILFVGAEGRMEMQRVPDAGYRIIGLPVAGFDRKHLWKNIGVLFKLLRSQWKARRIIKEFRPQVTVGVGGYASGPILKAAGMAGIPTLLQEQNSYPGVTNKLLAKKAACICVAYEGMEKFFPADKIKLTGNPVRKSLFASDMTRPKAIESFYANAGVDSSSADTDRSQSRINFNPDKKTILILGGSLGARTINQSLIAAIPLMQSNPDVQFIWQTGKYYIDQVRAALPATPLPNLYVTDFIRNMNSAYVVADLVVSRAGAGSISEFCLLGKPVILVPSPNVAEDHQTKNALALVDRGAALCVKDAEAIEKLMPTALDTVCNDAKLQALSRHIRLMGLPHAGEEIARMVLALSIEH